MELRKIVSQDEWLAARKQHLKKEKEFTRLRDELSAERRNLPWVRVEKQYALTDRTARTSRRPTGSPPR